MKRVNKNFQDLNKNIIIIGVILILSTIVGTYLNKIWPQYQEIGITNINKLKESYASDIPLINIIASNIKSDIMLMIGVLVSSLLVVTAPIAMCIFMIKGISIGYIINSTIIALQYEGMTIVILSIIKNIIIIPGIILLAIISIEYIKDTLKKYKKGEKRYMIFLAQRYTINGLIISGITVFVQAILNGVFIWVVKLFIN